MTSNWLEPLRFEKTPMETLVVFFVKWLVLANRKEDTMENIILLALLGLILGGAAGYVYKAKKKGAKCIGCPDGSKCSGSCSGCCGCTQE